MDAKAYSSDALVKRPALDRFDPFATPSANGRYLRI